MSTHLTRRYLHTVFYLFTKNEEKYNMFIKMYIKGLFVVIHGQDHVTVEQNHPFGETVGPCHKWRGVCYSTRRSAATVLIVFIIVIHI